MKKIKKLFLVFITLANLTFLSSISFANDYKNTNYFEFVTCSTTGNKFCYKTNSEQDLEDSVYTGITITPKIKASINHKYSIFNYQKFERCTP